MIRKKGFVIAIDGPVGSGKGTLAPMLASAVKGIYVDSGAMFRCVALYFLDKGLQIDDEETVNKNLPDITIDIEGRELLLNGKIVTDSIRNSEVAAMASRLGVIRKVREKLAELQRKLADTYIEQGKIVVAEGRDMGTTVFPHSPMKIYLTARLDVRAQRRFMQYRQKGEDFSFTQVVQKIKERDYRDSTRKLSPLTTEPEKFGYFIIDNSDLTERQTLGIIITELQKRNLI